MSLTPGYDPSALSPKIIISDLDGTEKYRFETTVTTASASPQQDFSVSDLAIHLGINADYGYATLKIQDPNNNLTDTTTLRRDSKIERQWNIEIYLGKSSGLLQRWFYGKIYDVDIVRPTTAQQHLILSCVGWGVVLRDRVTNLKRFQKKAADGLALDSADTTVKVSELFKDTLEDLDHLADQGLTQNHEVTVNNVDNIDLKLPDYQKSYTTFATALSELATIGNVMWGVDYDRDAFFRDPSSHDSGFLFTNNLSGDVAQNWSSSKIGYLLDSSQSWRDSSYDSAYSVLHGLGANSITKDQEQDGTENATRSSNTSWVAIPFTPEQNNIAKISVRMAKTGTPTASGTMELCAADGDNKPNRDSSPKTISLPGEKIKALGTSGDWVEFGLTEKTNVVEGTPLFIVFNIYGDASHNYTLDYQTGTGTFYTSADGDTWSSATGLFSFRQYASRSINIILENTRAKAKYGTREKVIALQGGLEEATARESLMSAGQVLGLERRFYSQVTVSPTTDRIPLGTFCRIEDSLSGLNIKANIISADIQMTSQNNTLFGATQIVLGLEEVHY